MRRAAAFVLALLALFVAAPADAAPDRAFLFVDQFNGTELRPIWHTRGTDYEVGSTLARGDDSAASIRDGMLRLRVLADPAHPGRYLNGHIGTEARFEFARGWAAVRAKVPPFPGSHAAFWVLTPTVLGDRAGHEVDVMESFGSDRPNAAKGTNVWHSVWYPDPAVEPLLGFPFVQETRSTNSAEFGTPPWWRRFHVFALHWTPSRYSFWIDGVRVAVISVGLTGVPKFLILSLLTRDWEVPSLLVHGLRSMVFRVDWVKVWRQD